MPYGLPKAIDTPENNAKIERCVADLHAKGTPKLDAILICKSSVIKAASK